MKMIRVPDDLHDRAKWLKDNRKLKTISSVFEELLPKDAPLVVLKEKREKRYYNVFDFIEFTTKNENVPETGIKYLNVNGVKIIKGRHTITPLSEWTDEIVISKDIFNLTEREAFYWNVIVNSVENRTRLFSRDAKFLLLSKDPMTFHLVKNI